MLSVSEQVDEASGLVTVVASRSSLRLARIAGLLYLIVGIFGGFALAYVTPKVYGPGDAATTPGNVLANSGLLRVGIVADLLLATVFFFLGISLYLLLKHVNKRMSAQLRAALLTLAIGSFVTVLAACGAPGLSGSGPTELSGSGPTKSAARSVDAFTRVEVGNGIGLTVHVGGAQAVEVLAQENILPLITTTVEVGILRIHSTESFTTTAEVTVATSVSALDGISISGGSRAQVEGLASDHLDIVLSGGAGLTATGRATDVTLDASGGARADLATLTVKTMSVKLSGGATAALSVSDRLTGTASGGAVAKVAGGAALNVQTSSGAGVTSS